jgi:MFS family permease
VDTTPRRILATYLALKLLSTFASSFIWGINTLFLLDGGLSVSQAFASNAFFTLSQAIFEVPTGVVADTLGRRVSYLFGAGTNVFSALLYFAMWRIHGPFWTWAIASALLGLGLSLFSGTAEAWLVDGLKATGFRGTLESAFAKGQIAMGAGMLVGAPAGGFIAQATNLGVPYVLRAVLLGLTFLVALVFMHDVGLTPRRGVSVRGEMHRVLRASLNQGLRRPPVRWLMMAGVFSAGVPVYCFFAMQPYLLELHGRSDYAVTGLAAALIAATQIAGASLVPWARKLFRRRTSAMLFGFGVSACALLLVGLVARFWVVLAALAAWGLLHAIALPIRQAFLNALIPSAQRATVLSSDTLLGSLGGVVAQPALGRVADLWSYSTSYVVAAAVQALALPFVLLARRERPPADAIPRGAASAGAGQ